MGYIRGLVHGAVVGTAVGLCIAPQTGEKTRAQLVALGHAAEGGYRQAEKMVKSIQARPRQQETVLAGGSSNGHR